MKGTRFICILFVLILVKSTSIEKSVPPILWDLLNQATSNEIRRLRRREINRFLYGIDESEIPESLSLDLNNEEAENATEVQNVTKRSDDQDVCVKYYVQFIFLQPQYFRSRFGSVVDKFTEPVRAQGFRYRTFVVSYGDKPLPLTGNPFLGFHNGLPYGADLQGANFLKNDDVCSQTSYFKRASDTQNIFDGRFDARRFWTIGSSVSEAIYRGVNYIVDSIDFVKTDQTDRGEIVLNVLIIDDHRNLNLDNNYLADLQPCTTSFRGGATCGLLNTKIGEGGYPFDSMCPNYGLNQHYRKLISEHYCSRIKFSMYPDEQMQYASLPPLVSNNTRYIPVRYHIDKYDFQQLRQIFESKISIPTINNAYGSLVDHTLQVTQGNNRYDCSQVFYPRVDQLVEALNSAGIHRVYSPSWFENHNLYINNGYRYLSAFGFNASIFDNADDLFTDFTECPGPTPIDCDSHTMSDMDIFGYMKVTSWFMLLILNLEILTTSLPTFQNPDSAKPQLVSL